MIVTVTYSVDVVKNGILRQTSVVLNHALIDTVA